MSFIHLTADKIAEIAAVHGFSPSAPLVIDNAKQADETHGLCRIVDGKPAPAWGTDSLGCYDAALLLDGLLAQEANDIRIEGLIADEHEREFR